VPRNGTHPAKDASARDATATHADTGTAAQTASTGFYGRAIDRQKKARERSNHNPNEGVHTANRQGGEQGGHGQQQGGHGQQQGGQQHSPQGNRDEGRYDQSMRGDARGGDARGGNDRDGNENRFGQQGNQGGPPWNRDERRDGPQDHQGSPPRQSQGDQRHGQNQGENPWDPSRSNKDPPSSPRR